LLSGRGARSRGRGRKREGRERKNIPELLKKEKGAKFCRFPLEIRGRGRVKGAKTA